MVSRPLQTRYQHNTRVSSSLKKDMCTPQKGILKYEKEKVTASLTKTAEEDQKERRVRFSIEAKSLAGESSDDVGDLSHHEGGMVGEMEFDIDDDKGENEDDLITTCGDLEDMEDSNDESDESDLDGNDGWIELDSNEEEEEGGEGDGMSRYLLETSSSRTSGIATSSEASCVYIPPHLREKKDSSKVRERLRKSVQGLINR